MRFASKLNSFLKTYGVIGVVLALLSFAYWRTLAPGVTWANNGSDSGDLITAAATHGIAHPTGYPTYLILARLFQIIPIGDLAFRTNLLSAMAALLTAGCIYRIIPHMVPSAGWEVQVGAGLAALTLGLSPLFWSQAVIAEVYTLNTGFAALIWYWTIRATRYTSFREWQHDLASVLIGLALGNHVTILFTAVAWWITIVKIAVATQRPWHMVRQVMVIGSGLLVYLYLPLYAASQPSINWGNPSNWHGFWWVITAQPYTHLAFSLPRAEVLTRLGAWMPLLFQQFGVVGVLVACVGLCSRHISASLRWLMLGVAVLHSAFALGYNTTDSYPYLLPVYLIVALWIGVGTITILRHIRGHSRHLMVVGAIGLGVACVWSLPTTARQIDASRDYRAIDYATQVLDAVPHNALVITTSDRDAFPLWYYHFALGKRPDITVIVEPLLAFAWYRENLHIRYPELRYPSAGVWTSAVLKPNDQPSFPICRVYAQQQMVTVCRTSTVLERDAGSR